MKSTASSSIFPGRENGNGYCRDKIASVHRAWSMARMLASAAIVEPRLLKLPPNDCRSISPSYQVCEYSVSTIKLRRKSDSSILFDCFHEWSTMKTPIVQYRYCLGYTTRDTKSSFLSDRPRSRCVTAVEAHLYRGTLRRLALHHREDCAFTALPTALPDSLVRYK